MWRYRVIVSVVAPAAIGGIVTGIILGIARVAGETAPLIFTIFGNSYGWSGWNQPMTALPLQIYTFLFSPPGDPTADEQYAFAGVIVLFALVIVSNLLARFLAARSGSRTELNA
jgi:phosphate transport system permease protein